jgi:hypothetical protein
MDNIGATTELISSAMVRAAVLKTFGFVPKATFVSSVKKLALEKLHGTVEQGYQKLQDYFRKLTKENPGTQITTDAP